MWRIRALTLAPQGNCWGVFLACSSVKMEDIGGLTSPNRAQAASTMLTMFMSGPNGFLHSYRDVRGAVPSAATPTLPPPTPTMNSDERRLLGSSDAVYGEEEEEAQRPLVVRADEHLRVYAGLLFKARARSCLHPIRPFRSMYPPTRAFKQ